VASAANGIIATVYVNDNGTFSLKEGVLDKGNGIAYGSFVDTINETGWSQLNIRSGYGNDQHRDSALMYAAGYLEGAITAERIYQQYNNMDQILFRDVTNETISKLKTFFLQQEAWMVEMIESNGNDSFWRHVGLIFQQYRGLIDGYGDHHLPGQELDEWAFQMLNGNGDLFDLIPALDKETIPKWEEMSLEEIRHKIAMRGHCSVLIKMTPGYEDVLAAHASWFMYSAMLRIFKHYSFNLSEETTGSRTMSFSSYPGYLSSADDYYQMGSGLVMLQTTNGIYNTDLYDLLTPKSLLAWQRVRTACQKSHNATEWTDAVARYNSGTYNNQYMVLDLTKISLKKGIQDNALRVAEQVPGLVVSDDLSPILRAGYFASYNIPFFEQIYNQSGYPEFVAKHGVEFSYQLAPRAEIFRRDQTKVTDIESLKYMMRYNNYKNEEYADGNACNTVCCRGDLLSKPEAGGCFDAKVTNYTMALSQITYGISGPTTEDGLPPFSFEGQFANLAHFGLVMNRQTDRQL
jgi:hypothetical protein